IFFFYQAEDGIRDRNVTGVQTCALPIYFLVSWQSQAEESHWLMRAKDNLRYEVIHHNAAHDFQIKMPVSARAKKINPSLGDYWRSEERRVGKEGICGG